MVLSAPMRSAALRGVARDALLKMEPEIAHRATVAALRLGLVPTSPPDPPGLAMRLCGLDLPNPLGMAAGFDKNAEVPGALARIGFGFVEVGTLTPLPQQGNPTPRVFRIPAAQGIVNRLGFNNQGHAAALERLKSRRPGTVLGVNIGANKTSPDFVADYVKGVEAFSDVADYLTVNISSPNTPGLRDLQGEGVLNCLLDAVCAARETQKRRIPIVLKIAPDLDDADMDSIARAVLESRIDAMIVSNTTLSRDAVSGLPHAEEGGGLSGKPLFALATRRLAQMRLRLGPDFPLIGVGGIHSAQSAVAKFEAGANAVQLYSGLVFGGFDLIAEIKTGLARAVADRGLASVADLTAAAVEDWASGKAGL